MVTRQQISLVDDIDGSAAEGTTRFMLDDVNYEIDLSAPHAIELRERFGRYIDAGRKVSRTPPPRTAAKHATDKSVASAGKEHRRKIRAWAKRTGWTNPATGNPVGDIGQLPAQLLADYEAAQTRAAVVVRDDGGNGRRVPAVTFAEPVSK